MFILRPQCLLATAFAGLLVASIANAQGSAPKGACVVKGGKWCWPVKRGKSNSPCECRTRQGTKQGKIK